MHLMHVLIVPSWYPTRDNQIRGSFFREQALALHDYGHKVGVIYPDLRSLKKLLRAPRWRSFTTHEVDDGLNTVRYHGVAWFPRLPRAGAWLWVRQGMRLYDQYVLEHGRPDIVHAHSMLNAGLLASMIERHHNVPYVVTEHSSAFARGLLTEAQISRAATVALVAQRRFAVSHPLCRLLESILGRSSGVWEEMPNIVSRPFQQAPLRSRNHGDSVFRFVSVAHLNENKGMDLLINAFAQSFSGHSDAKLEIGGDGVERKRLESLAHELGVGRQVHFHGSLKRDDVIALMSRCDAFVLASHYETFGVVVVEALALGKPVIATRSGGPDGIVRDEDGLLVPPGNPDALANALRHMRTHYDRFDSKSIREGCIERYGEAAIAQRLTSAYACQFAAETLAA